MYVPLGPSWDLTCGSLGHRDPLYLALSNIAIHKNIFTQSPNLSLGSRSNPDLKNPNPGTSAEPQIGLVNLEEELPSKSFLLCFTPHVTIETLSALIRSC